MQRGFVRKRGTTWTAYYYIGAKPNRRQYTKGGFQRKRDAQAFLNSVLGAMQSGDYVEPRKLTLREYLLDRWLPTQESNLRPSTFESYQRVILLHVLPVLGDVPLQSLTADQLDRLYRDLLRGGRKTRTRYGEALSPKSVRYIHTTLHKALRDAQRKQLVTRNVADAADPPKLRQSGDREMLTWSADEVRRFLGALDGHRLHAAFVLAATTGMRRGEVLGARWRDLDVSNRRLAVRQTVLTVNYQIVLGTPKTERGRRSIALDAATVAALEAHQLRQAAERDALGTGYRDRGLIFAREDGGPVHPDYFSQLFDRTVRRLGLPKIRLHDLRHTHATLGLAAGVAPKVMSDRLGHATVAFTQDVYMHCIPALESDAADQVAALIFGEGAPHE
jgi:integrase